MKQETSESRKKMPNRRQIERLIHIVSVLKQNRKVTVASLVADFSQESRRSAGAFSDCSPITVKRDLRLLRECYGCPIRYDRSEKTLKLDNLFWEFNMPSLVSDQALMAAVLGGKLAEDILPSSVSWLITDAVDELLKNNSADFRDRTMVQSLKIFAKIGTEGSPEIFPVVFNAWMRHHVLKITYEKPGDAAQERIIQPMALVFSERKWLVCGPCEGSQGHRKFVLSRILKAEMLPQMFEADQQYIDSLTPETFLEYDMLHDVTIQITARAKAFVEGNFISCRPKITPIRGTGAFLLKLSRVPMNAVVPWVLAQAGEATVLSPPQVIDAVAKAARAILETTRHSTAKP